MRAPATLTLLLLTACSHGELRHPHSGPQGREDPQSPPVQLQGRPQPSPDAARVRLYAAPIPRIGWLAVHTWFAVRRPGGREERWEVWQDAGGPHAHVRKDLSSPRADVGAGGTFLVAELRGPRAAAVGAVIQRASPLYPCRTRYHYFPGPNSNTYTRWALEISGWQARLPARALGAGFYSRCL